MNKHSKGPWKAGPALSAPDAGVIKRADGKIVAYVPDPDDLPVISAAPEMLPALGNMLNRWERVGVQEEEQWVYDYFREIEAKAKGEDQ
jgi:hypothetical protein